LDEALRGEIAEALADGRAFLLTQQDEGGGFGDTGAEVPPNVSYTAMATNALVGAVAPTEVREDAAIGKGLAFLRKFKQPNGSIVDDPRITNYCTSVAVSAFAAARIAEYAKDQAEAAAYLASSQIQDDTGDPSHGGFPYKQHLGQSADGSNALIATNALEDNGLAADSPVRERVGTFASKLHNNSETNPGELVIEVEGEKRVVVAGDDGGAYYRVGESKAGMAKRSDGRWELRSYGSMTYAVLKLLLFAGIDADDPRVKGVVRWISQNWTVERNPGFEGNADPQKAGQQGFFYYLYTVARALAAYEQSTKKPLVVTDAAGRQHNWRREVARELLSRQAEDGSWRNDVAARWEEGSQTLATSFAMQTLAILTGRLP
jgi:squalene-hopene/tetraprenyl-beta-curcumene cyclase